MELSVGAVALVVAAILGWRLLTSTGRAPAVVPAAGSWAQVADLPGVRGGTTGVLLPDARALVVGGGTGFFATAATALFDPASGRWTPAGPLHQARRGNATVVLPDGRALTAGGISGRRVLASVEAFDAPSGSWREVAAMLQPRLDFDLVVLRDGRLLAVGGSTAGEGGGPIPLAGAEIYDAAADRWTALPSGLATARHGARSVVMADGRVLVVGGSGEPPQGAVPLSSVELFDPETASFLPARPMREPRQDPSVTVLRDGRVLVAGGSSRESTLASAELYDPRSGGWTPTGSMRVARRLQGAASLGGGSVLVAGGETLAFGSRSALAAAEVYNPATGGWTDAGTMSCPRSDAAAVRLGDGRVLVAGGDAVAPGSTPRAQSCAEVFRT